MVLGCGFQKFNMNVCPKDGWFFFAHHTFDVKHKTRQVQGKVGMYRSHYSESSTACKGRHNVGIYKSSTLWNLKARLHATLETGLLVGQSVHL